MPWPLLIMLACMALAAWRVAAQEQLKRAPDSCGSSANKGGFAEPGGAASAAALPNTVPSAQTRDALMRINSHRAAGANCGSRRYEPAPPLAWNQGLEQAAQAHARDMAARRALSHSGSDGSTLSERVARVGYNWVALGENVSAGHKSIPDAVEGWMKSPGHCGNIMGPQFREVGLGAAQSDGEGYGWYRAMVLAARR